MPKVVTREPMSVLERSFVPEIIRGLSTTIKHFFHAASGQNYHEKQHLWFLNKGNVTYNYPEDVRTYPKRYRGQHRLMLREDGNVRCVACMCCSTICPANCIHITAAESDDPSVEKYPASFVIDELRCIFCGFCVEACPCDAIRMDTGLHVQPFLDRNNAYYGRDILMELGELSVAIQGGDKS